MQNNSISHTCQHLWLSKVADTTREIEEQTKLLLSASEKKRFNATKSLKKQREFLLSRALMRHALSQLFDIPLSDWQFINTDRAAPIISNLPQNTYFSLSHSNGFICFIASPEPVGIDTENLSRERRYFEAAELFMSDEEINTLKSESKTMVKTNFYRVWCAKEAYFKASTINYLFELKDINIIDLLNNTNEWHLMEQYIEQHLISIVSKNKTYPVIQHWL